MSSSSTNARDAQKIETRRRILDSAKRLCARRGFARTRTIDVAKHARVSHGSVFVHFGSRQELINNVIGAMSLEITNAVHARARGGASLRETLQAHLDALAEHEDAVRWLLLEAPQSPQGYDVAFLGLQSAISAHISQSAERDMAAGRVRRMPLHLLFNTWIALVHYYVINRELFAPERNVLRAIAPELLDHFMGLVEAPATNGRRR